MRLFQGIGREFSCDSIVLYDVGDLEATKKFGEAILDQGNNRIVRVREKPEDPRSTLILTFMEIYPRHIIQKLLDFRGSGRNLDRMGDFNAWLVEKGESVYGYKLDGRWFDTGNSEHLEEAREYYEKKFDSFGWIDRV